MRPAARARAHTCHRRRRTGVSGPHWTRAHRARADRGIRPAALDPWLARARRPHADPGRGVSAPSNLSGPVDSSPRSACTQGSRVACVSRTVVCSHMAPSYAPFDLAGPSDSGLRSTHTRRPQLVLSHGLHLQARNVHTPRALTWIPAHSVYTPGILQGHLQAGGARTHSTVTHLAAISQGLKIPPAECTHPPPLHGTLARPVSPGLWKRTPSTLTRRALADSALSGCCGEEYL